MELQTGFEPAISGLKTQRLTTWLLQQDGAPGRSRTGNLPHTKRVLCQLSFRGMDAAAGLEPAITGYGPGLTPCLAAMEGEVGLEPTMAGTKIQRLTRLATPPRWSG